MVEERLRDRMATSAPVRARLPALEADVAEGAMSPAAGADELARLLGF